MHAPTHTHAHTISRRLSPFHSLTPPLSHPPCPLTHPPTLLLQVVDLIRRLLAWQPLRRLGCLTDHANDVKNHSFFGQIDWSGLYSESMVPPRKPELQGETDYSCFEEAEDGDTGFLSETPYVPESGAWDAEF